MILELVLSWFKSILAFLGFSKTSQPYRGDDAEGGKTKMSAFKKGGDESKTLLSQGNDLNYLTFCIYF